jgi:hypothetical protein
MLLLEMHIRLCSLTSAVTVRAEAAYVECDCSILTYSMNR